LDYSENPNGEDILTIKRYNGISQEIYKNAKEIRIEDYSVLWNSLGASKEIIDRIGEKTIEYSNNKTIVEAIRTIHGQALEIGSPIKIISFPSGVCRYRKAVRAIVFDGSGKMALLHVAKHGYHKLPGGGSEEGEDNAMTLRRECIEEIGCAINVGDRIGWVLEYQEKGTLRQYSFCYEARVNGEKRAPLFTDEEIVSGFCPIWVSLDEAMQLLREDTPDGDTEKSIVERDLAFLLEYSKRKILPSF